MKRNVLIVGLWFYASWYAASMAAYTFGYPEVVGPIVGAIVATVVATRLRRATPSTLKDPQGDQGRASIGNAAGQEIG